MLTRPRVDDEQAEEGEGRSEDSDQLRIEQREPAREGEQQHEAHGSQLSHPCER